MRKNLITCAFPRSGQTFLNYALKHLYYTDEVNVNYHSVKSLINIEKPIVALRNPLDCITSWADKNNDNLIDDINHYLRFHNAVLENKDKSVVLEFDKFTVDGNYVIDKIKKAFGVDPINAWDLDAIKSSMLEHEKEQNLPFGNYDNINRLKQELQSMLEFEKCEELYVTLKL